jgi:polyribonucleotide 5'-hydroxyl-kinase
MFILDHPDKEGRPVVLMRPRNEDVFTGDPEERIKWLVYTLEQASRRADQTSPDGKMTWLIDFVGNTRKNSPPISVSMRTLYILQHHYPERLGRAVSFQPPMIFQITWKAVSPFVDPVTYKKLVFLRHKQEEEAHKALGEHFYMEHIDDTLGGGMPLEDLWDFEEYGEKMKAADQEFRDVLKIYDDAMQGFEEEEEEEGEFHDASSDCEVA